MPLGVVTLVVFALVVVAMVLQPISLAISCVLTTSVQDCDTALIEAAFEGKPKIVELLLKSGANIDHQNQVLCPIVLSLDRLYG